MAESKEVGHSTAEIQSAPIGGVLVAEGSGKTAELEGATTKQVHNAELFAALQESPIERWSSSSIKLYYCIFIAFCCSCANGYDGSLLGSILAMTQFQHVFNVGSSGHKVSVITSLYSVGSIVTTPFAAMVSDRFGRRVGMVAGAFGIIIGSIIAATSSTMAQLTVGRFVLGCGIQYMTVSAPAYSIEITPPHWRGRATGFYNCGWFGGSIPASCITYGCQFISSNYSWRTPLILQCFTCIIVLASVYFIPESPRFLMSKGRNDEAIAFLTKYHGNGNPNSRLVQLEIEEIKENLRQDAIDKASAWWDYRPFLTHVGRWRGAQAIMMGIFGQFAGNGLGYFNVAIYELIGIDSPSQQLAYQILYNVLGAIGALTAVSLTDRMPRRPVLIYGTLGITVLLAINGGLTNASLFYCVNLFAMICWSLSTDKIGRRLIICCCQTFATVILFVVGALWWTGAQSGSVTGGTVLLVICCFWSFSFQPISMSYYLYSAELPSAYLRTKTGPVTFFINSVLGIATCYATPPMLLKMGVKSGFVFGAFSVPICIAMWLMVPETKGRSAAEIDELYERQIPAWRWNKTVTAVEEEMQTVVQIKGNIGSEVKTVE